MLKPDSGTEESTGLVDALYADVVDQTLMDAEPSLAAVIEMVRLRRPLLQPAQAEATARLILARLHGMGPLEELLLDQEISEVMVNGVGHAWVERNGTLSQSPVQLTSKDINGAIERVVAPLGLRIDRTSPLVDARLPDGSRVNIVVPPIAIDGPYITIRRFARSTLPLTAFCSSSMERVLVDAVQSRRNIVVSGGTGAGKTTLLNALASSLGEGERIITIEDAAELQLPGRHVVRLEARPSNGDGVGAVTIRELLRNALRMRPDRIIVGEVRGGEALEMVQAMNTGHAGSMSTVHASSPAGALRRLETMMLQADIALPLDAVREHLQSAVDLIVQVERGAEGQRHISAVVSLSDGGELTSLDDGPSCMDPG